MANPSNIPKRNCKGISTRYSEVIYDQSKTHGSNFFLMLANSIANYENRRNVGDNSSEKQDNEKVTERNSYTSTTEEADEGTKEVHNVEGEHNHRESWRKYFKFFGGKVKKRSNAIAKKYIKRGKSYAIQHKYIGRIIKRHRCDYFVFNVANASKTSKSKGSGDKRVTLVEREWIAAHYAKRFGNAPELVDDVIVLESLMKKTKFRYIGSKYVPNKILQDADQVVTLTWGSAPTMKKCWCPLQDCICSGDSLLLPEKIPRGSWIYHIPLVWQMMTWFTSLGESTRLLVPDLIRSASVEQKLYQLMEEKKILASYGPEMCLHGCRGFYYYAENSTGEARRYRKDELRKAIADGSEMPMKADTIIDRLKEEDPRISDPPKLPSEPIRLPSIKAKSEAQEVNEPVEEPPPPPEDPVEEEEEKEPQNDRICNYKGKCTVSSQVERGEDGEFEISYPYEIMFPRTLKNISGTKLNVCSIYADLKSGAMRLEHLIPIQSIKRRWYDKWKKEFYLSVFHYPERCTVVNEETRGTQTDEILKSCLKEDKDKVVPTSSDTPKIIKCWCDMSPEADEIYKSRLKEDKEKVAPTSDKAPTIIKCRCDIVSPEVRSVKSHVSYVPSKQSLQKTHQAPSGTAEQVPKVTPDAKAEPTSGLPPEAAPKSPNTSSMQKGLPIKDSLIFEKDANHSTDKTSKVPKKSRTSSSSAPNTDTAPVNETSEPPKKAVSLEERPKRTKTGFFSRRSKKSVEIKKESKTDKVTKIKEAASKAKKIRNILRSSKVTGDPSGHKLENQPREESSREQIIKDIIFEPQTLPQDNLPKSKTSISSREKESDSNESTDSNESKTKTQSKTSGSYSKAVRSVAADKQRSTVSKEQK